MTGTISPPIRPCSRGDRHERARDQNPSPRSAGTERLAETCRRQTGDVWIISRAKQAWLTESFWIFMSVFVITLFAEFIRQ